MGSVKKIATVVEPISTAAPLDLPQNWQYWWSEQSDSEREALRLFCRAVPRPEVDSLLQPGGALKFTSKLFHGTYHLYSNALVNIAFASNGGTVSSNGGTVSLCVHPLATRSLPLFDQILTLKWWIEGDEADFARAAMTGGNKLLYFLGAVPYRRLPYEKGGVYPPSGR